MCAHTYSRRRDISLARVCEEREREREKEREREMCTLKDVHARKLTKYIGIGMEPQGELADARSALREQVLYVYVCMHVCIVCVCVCVCVCVQRERQTDRGR